MDPSIKLKFRSMGDGTPRYSLGGCSPPRYPVRWTRLSSTSSDPWATAGRAATALARSALVQTAPPAAESTARTRAESGCGGLCRANTAGRRGRRERARRVEGHLRRERKERRRRSGGSGSGERRLRRRRR